jgi:hypothetical protein
MRRADLGDYALVKKLCNHPKIRRHQNDTTTELDPIPWFADPRHIILIDGDNCMVFAWRWIGIYEVHILFTLSGRQATDLCRAMLNLMLNGPAQMLLAVIPKHLRHVILFARRFGFAFKGETETIEGPCQLYQLEAAQWAS